MLIFLGGLALLLTVCGFWFELLDEDPAELDRTWRESWRAMSWAKRCEFASMLCVGTALIFDGMS